LRVRRSACANNKQERDQSGNYLVHTNRVSGITKDSVDAQERAVHFSISIVALSVP
jgi:hypothetical protein